MKIKRKREDIPFFPHHVINQMIVVCIVILILLLLATFYSTPIEEKADLFTTPSSIKPVWYFVAIDQILMLIPGESTGVIGLIIFLLLVFMLPFIDRNPECRPLKRPFVMIIGLIVVIGFILLTLKGIYS
ncbi:MAG: hypothetical protein HY999_06020 [Nitrospinae bacterium]|nr:hypothetical protein [Nitrospinota bacterium]